MQISFFIMCIKRIEKFVMYLFSVNYVFISCFIHQHFNTFDTVTRDWCFPGC